MRQYLNPPRRGSHLPVLMQLVPRTSGPILELGCGVYSTIFLHWSCFPTQRRLVSYEDNPNFHRFANQFRTDWHEIHCITTWEELDSSGPWSVAFVDHGQDERRYLDIARLTHAEYVVAHDAENSSWRKYHYERIHDLFKYRAKYSKASPHTAIYSNFHDLSDLSL